MNSFRTKKFCLSRTEEYYYEESLNESNEDCSTIFRLIHQTALNRNQKDDIKTKVQNVFNQQQPYYPPDDSLFADSANSTHLNLSFNRKKYDLLHNKINYVRPVEMHKQRQSDVLPLNRYDQILDNSPFDSPLAPHETAHRRATVLPGFKPLYINQSTQTHNSITQNLLYDERSSIYRQSESIRQSTAKSLVAQTSNRSTSAKSSIDLPSNSFNQLSKSSNKLIDATLSKITNISVNFSNKSANISNKSANVSHKSANVSHKSFAKAENKTNSTIKDQSEKKSMINSTATKVNDAQNKLKDVSNVSGQQSKYQSVFNSKYDQTNDDKRTKKRKSKYYDKTDFISFSKAQIFEPDDEAVNHAQTELIESLLDSSTFKDLNLDSLISKKSNIDSIKNSTQGKTKNYTGSFTDPTKSIHKSVRKSDLNIEKSAHKSSSKTSNKSSKEKTSLSLRPDAREVRKIINKNSIRKVDQEEMICDFDKIDEVSDVSLILNSTCSQEELNGRAKPSSEKELDNNLEFDISVIGFETSMTSDVDVVFDDESISDRPSSLPRFNEDIELIRKSDSHHSSFELSLGSTSISETLSQSIEKSLSRQIEQVKQSENEDLSIEFESNDEEKIEKSPAKIDKSLEKTPAKAKEISSVQKSNSSIQNHQSTSLKSTPKSILKNSSKRIWDASEFSLANLTVGSSANKSISNRKGNSVRFSDKISSFEKFTPTIGLKRDDKEIQLNTCSLDQSIDRSISKSISKRIDEAIDTSKSEKYDKIEDSVEESVHQSIESKPSEDNLPNLEDSYELNEKSSSLEQSVDEESEEESLNVTIDDLSQSLENISDGENDEENEQNDDAENEDSNDRTPLNTHDTKFQSTFTVKSLKKPRKRVLKNVEVARKQQPKYYETFVDKTPTIIYPNCDEDSSDMCVRRSNRVRVRPLDFWRSQKPKYKLDSETKCMTIDGIEKGFSVDNPFKKRIVSNRPKKLTKKKSKKRIRHSDDEEQVVVKRVRYGLNDEVSIHQQLSQSAIELSEKIKREATEYCAQHELNWSESKQSKGVYIAFMSRRKDKQGNTQASGFMKLESLLQKPPQRSANYVTNYVLMFGAAKVRISDKPDEKLEDKPPVILRSMDAFTVKPNALFSIENLRKDELLLYFDVTKA